MPELLDESSKMESTTIGVYRTAAVMKGGRRFSFGALVVVGNRNGQVGFGYAKSNEVPMAVDKSQKYGQKKLLSVPRTGTTIHHQVEGHFGSAKVRLIPASPGSGIVAGTVVRAVLELAGISDCLTKCYGSTNPVNVLKATFDAITQFRSPDAIAALRGQKLEQTEIESKIEKGRAFAPAAKRGDKPRGPVNTVGDQNRRGGRGGRGPGGGGMNRRDRQAASAAGDTPAAAPAAPTPPAA